MSVKQVKLGSALITLNDMGVHQETEAILRFSINGDDEEPFAGGDKNLLKAIEQAIRQMLIQYGLLEGKQEGSFFQSHRVGITKSEVYSVRLYSGPDHQDEVSYVTHDDCLTRAAIVAVCKLYQKELDVTFVFPLGWKAKEETPEEARERIVTSEG